MIRCCFPSSRRVDKARGTTLRTWHGAWRAASTSQYRQRWWMRCAYPPYAVFQITSVLIEGVGLTTVARIAQNAGGRALIVSGDA